MPNPFIWPVRVYFEDTDAGGVVLFVVKNVSVEYKRSAVLDDHLQVTAEISGMRGASLEFDQAVWRGDTLLSTARTKIVCVDKNRMRPVPIPEMVAEKMLAGREHD